MKFVEALRIAKDQPTDVARFRVALACGFTPLHLQTFLAAHVQRRLPDRKVEVATGLFGGLPEAAESWAKSPGDVAAIALEWADLDPRLQYRQLGGWSPADLADIVKVVESQTRRLESAIRNLPGALRVALSLPTLPLPPAFFTPGCQASEAELGLRQAVIDLGRAAAQRVNVAVVSTQHLDRVSPPASRFDLRGELLTGLPYTMEHADALGAALAELLLPPPPKKGLITDLDDTLWNGIIGDAGADGVSWDLASHGQIHGLYQQTLRALAAQGALIAVASKNDVALVRQAFARPDMLLREENVFPLEVHWNAKSGSVGRILKTWNVAADSVVYVDDSPMELAEVEQAHPGIHCIRFPKDDYANAEAFLRELRNLFGKSRVTEEDALRLNSIRQSEAFQQIAESGGSAPEEFLAQMRARVTVDFERAGNDPRALELINKTNQFNLNGVRLTEADWHKQLARPGAFAASIAYEDKFGPLGKIAVMLGTREGDVVRLRAWVMSCRAFARRIEYQCLRILFDRFGAESIEFDFAATPKNGPLQDFFGWLLDGREGEATVSRQAFDQKCPVLYHTVTGPASPKPEPAAIVSAE